MKISFNRARMQQVFSVAAGVAPTRSPKAILQNVKVVASGGDVYLYATDTEICVRARLTGATVDQPGECLLPVQRFQQILKESKADELSITVVETPEKSAITVKGDRGRWNLALVRSNEYPSMNFVAATNGHRLQAANVKTLLGRTSFAAEDGEYHRYTLAGVLLEFLDGCILGIATDGRRIAYVKCAGQMVGTHSPPLFTIVPLKGIGAVSRAFAGAEGEAVITADLNKVQFSTPDLAISVRLTEGRFVRWQDIFSMIQPAFQVVVNVGEFASVLRQASIVTNLESRSVTLQFGQGRILVSSSTQNVGDSETEFAVEYDGDEFEVMLNPQFVIEFLNTLGSETSIVMHVGSANREQPHSEASVLFTCGDDYRYIVQPMTGAAE